MEVLLSIENVYIAASKLHIEDLNHLEENFSILRKHISESGLDLISDNTGNLNKRYFDLLLFYIQKLECHLLVNSKDIINSKESQSLVKLLRELIYYGIITNLFKTRNILNLNENNLVISQKSNEITLELTIGRIRKVLESGLLSNQKQVDIIMLYYLAAIFISPKYFEEHSLIISKTLSKPDLFKNLLILKGSFESTKIQAIVHKFLLKQLYTDDGFSSLALNICKNPNEQAPTWKQNAIVANIIDKTLKPETTNFMTGEIFKFLDKLYGETEIQNNLISACTTTLNRIYKTHPKQVTNKMTEELERMCNTQELITAHILLEHKEFKSFLNRLWVCFVNSSSNNELLPSIILYPYTFVIISLYNRLPKTLKQEKEHIKLIILKILNKRTINELNNLVENIFDCKIFTQLDQRINFKYNTNNKQYSLQVESISDNKSFEIISSLLDALKSSSNIVLNHTFFVIFLRNVIEKPDIPILLKFEMINFLTELISDRNYCSYLSNHPEELLRFVEHLIENILANIGDIQNLHLLLSIVNELYDLHDFNGKFGKLAKLLKDLKSSSLCEENSALKHQCTTILNKLEKQCYDCNINEFSNIRSLTNEPDAYLQVYGLSKLIDLIEARDIEAKANQQTIIGMAVNALRNEESFVYLKAVKVIVSLLAMDSTLIYTLCEEFLDKNETLNYRLKIGEVLVKVLESSNINSHEFKKNLINCFLSGCKDNQEEIVCSSYANLGTICKFYSFDVHNFFYEIIRIIEITIGSQKMLLAKRASIFFLKELLFGVQDNLIEFGDNLPSIYRLLDNISKTTNDPVMRTHANNGLQILSNKCLRFIFPEQKLLKTIKIV
ncbi:TANGO6 family protein [Megaselia abdita]